MTDEQKIIETQAAGFTCSTPAGVVVEYFESLRWLVKATNGTSDSILARRLAAMCTIMAVNAVEVFLNLWFRVLVTERSNAELQEMFSKELENKVTLEQKLSQWPKKYLFSEMDLSTGVGRAFASLKFRRNKIIHFSSSHETIRAPQIIIHCLADTTDYDALCAASADEALNVAEALVTEIFRLAGFNAIEQNNALAVWIGKRGADRLVENDGTALPAWLAPHVSR